jgi:hypothetical protein
MRDFKIWIRMKQLENPYSDYMILVHTFTDGFYGPAGKFIRDFLTLLEQVADESDSDIKFQTSLSQYRYLTSDFINEAQTIFDHAEKSVSDEPVLLRRVHHARLSLDRAALLVPNTGLNREFVSQRYLNTLYEQIDLRVPKSRIIIEKQNVDDELKQLLVH